jgi:putative peptidoglycan lipid II flippase
VNRRAAARNTAVYGLAVAGSRLGGLVREAVAAAYFGVSGVVSAFTIAFQFPNLIRALVADTALEGALIPVLTDLLEKGKRREAARLLSGLIFLVATVVSIAVALLTLAAPLIVPVLAPGFPPELERLTTRLAQLMLPTVVLLSLVAVSVATLNSFNHFTVPALAPLAWNVTVVVVLVALHPVLDEEDGIYAYAIGVLAGTVVQLLLPLPWLRGRGLSLELLAGWRNPHVRQVLALMPAVVLSIGLVNVNLLVDSFFGTLVSEEVPAALDKAFRLYVLPQGLFAVSVSAIIFPMLARQASRGDLGQVRDTTEAGVRYIAFFLIPSAVLLAVLAEPVTRLVFERGEFDARDTDLVAEALFWWAASLPFQGVSMLLSRTFFSLQRPWLMAGLAAGNVAVNALLALLLYEPFGIAGIVLATAISTISMAAAQLVILHRALPGGLSAQLTLSVARMLAGSAAVGVTATLAFDVLSAGQGLSIVAASAAAASVYVACLWLLGADEPRELVKLLRR